LITITDGRCAITDYKTGVANDHHAQQLHIYQLLWSRDLELNPDQLPVAALTLSYSTNDVSIEPLSPSELDTLAAELVARIRAVEDDISFQPPPARPAPEMCHLCSVRHLCKDYWVSSTAGADSNEFVDREGTIVSQNGPRSWIMDVEQPQPERVLVQTPTEDAGFDAGDVVRLLDVVRARDEDTRSAVITVTRSSEVYQLA
jgi:hypothetical protein